jgi:phenylpyruvate tautomerase
MPTLRIFTNAQVPPDARAAFLAGASRTVAHMLGKPESYVMVAMEDGRDLIFAGNSAPAAYLELKSLGLPEGRTAQYSRTLCDLLQSELGIPAERIYIEFASPAPSLFGWNGGTF